MKRRCGLASAAVVAWLALFSSVLAEAPTAPVSTLEPSVAAAGVQASAQVDGGDAASIQPPKMPTPGQAQNGVFIEALGPGLLYSANYERLFLDKIAVRVGFAYWFAVSDATYVSVPTTITYVGLRGFETGGGISVLAGQGGLLGDDGARVGFNPYATALAGYRLHPRGGAGFQLRVGTMAILGPGMIPHASTKSIGVLPSLYLSVGAGF